MILNPDLITVLQKSELQSWYLEKDSGENGALGTNKGAHTWNFDNKLQAGNYDKYKANN